MGLLEIMIRQITSLLRHIVGRIKKKKMIGLRIGVTGFTLPIGFGLLLFAIQMKPILDRSDYWGLLILAIGMFFIGITSWLSAIKAADKEREIEMKKYFETRQLLENYMKELISEVKGLRKDITNKGDR